HPFTATPSAESDEQGCHAPERNVLHNRHTPPATRREPGRDQTCRRATAKGRRPRDPSFQSFTRRVARRRQPEEKPWPANRITNSSEWNGLARRQPRRPRKPPPNVATATRPRAPIALQPIAAIWEF